MVSDARVDVATAVRAIREGAFDVLQCPISDDEILDRIRLAIEVNIRELRQKSAYLVIADRFARLTRREKQVLDLIIQGFSNGETAHFLGIVEGTVEQHRSQVMKKMEASRLADLMPMVFTLMVNEGKLNRAFGDRDVQVLPNPDLLRPVVDSVKASVGGKSCSNRGFVFTQLPV